MTYPYDEEVKMPPLSTLERWAMVAIYASSAITTVSVVALIVLHFTG